MCRDMYTSGEYLQKNPTWDAEDAPWKVRHILDIMKKNNIDPVTICEVGCGAGEILVNLQRQLSDGKQFVGYEISPQAFEICKPKSNDRLSFKLGDILKKESYFDLILLIDVIEHIEDYFHFLRELKSKSQYKILHVPLDLSAQTILRISSILRDRSKVGHVHYFTRELILKVLEECGYDIIDEFYPQKYYNLLSRSFKTRLAECPRRILSAINQDFAVRLLGGRTLMVLVK